MPIDREGNRSIAQHAEIERVMLVLPDIVPAKNDVLAKCLLQSGVKLVLEPGLQYSRYSRRAKQQRIQYRVRTALARQHQVFVERTLQRSRIGDAQHGVRALDAVGRAQSRLCLPRD